MNVGDFGFMALFAGNLVGLHSLRIFIETITYKSRTSFIAGFFLFILFTNKNAKTIL
jgi:hypothetical protein